MSVDARIASPDDGAELDRLRTAADAEIRPTKGGERLLAHLALVDADLVIVGTITGVPVATAVFSTTAGSWGSGAEPSDRVNGVSQLNSHSSVGSSRPSPLVSPVTKETESHLSSVTPTVASGAPPALPTM